MADLLNGVPSIVIGIFAWTDRGSHEALLGLGRRLRLSVMLIPIAARSTEQFLRAVPQSLREGALALGASKWRTDRDRSRAGAIQRNRDRHDLGVARIAGETAPLLFTSLNNQFWSSGLEPAHRFASGHDLHSRDLAL